MAKTSDVVIVGGGHNGLVCGTYLAKAGLSVCVLERRNLIGGAAVTEELWPGYRLSTASYVMSLLQPKIILDLELAKFGFEVLKLPPVFQRLSSGHTFLFWDDEREAAAELARIDPASGANFVPYRNHLRAMKPIMQRLLWEIPVDPGSQSVAGGLSIARFAWRFRDVGERFYQIFDLLTMSADEYLARWFKSADVRTIIGFYAGCAGGHFTSPRMPGTAFVLLRPVLRDMDTPAGGFGFMKGGMGAISQAIARSGKRFGLEVRTGAEVAAITTRNGEATGVALVSGEEIRARIVVANASIQTVYNDLLAREEVTPEFHSAIDNIRSESSSFKLNLAVDRLTEVVGFDPKRAGFEWPVQVRIAPSLEYMERAMQDLATHHFSPSPAMLFMVPSLVDSTLAPAGKHVVNVIGNHAPYTLRGTTWEEQREPLFNTAIQTLEDHLPGFGNTILHAETLTPLDLERRFGLPRGHIHHSEITTDQIFFKRPVPRHADYRSPVGRLYHCGASNHPGGGVTGVPGHNAARVILKDQKWRKSA